MKKGIILLLISFLLLSTLEGKAENLIIPKEAIRFRVIANSNSENDQNLKIKVRNQIQTELFSLMQEATKKEEASSLMKKSLPRFDALVNEITSKENETYQLSYGSNYFPQKIYRGVEYPEGNYESLVVTLGEGNGDNWWCVLFPPLCLLEAEETEDTTEVEYQFFLKEMIDRFF